MDKHRGVRRGVSRFSTARFRAKQSRHKLCGGLDGDFEFPEKSRKEKVRSLSAVGRALSSYEDYKMGCDVIEKVDTLRAQSPSSTSKRFKIAKRFLDDCNGVGHASVPRKLRSAVKKRNREYSFPDSEKVNHKLNGIESPGKDCIKKTKKQGNIDWSPTQTVSGPITKDEEEVVETLYALAGMFLNNDWNESRKLEGDSSPENSNLQDLEKSTNYAFEDSGTAQDSHPSYAERSPEEAVNTNSSNESNGRKQPGSLENAEFLMASDNVASNLNLETMPTLMRSKNDNEVTLDDSELSLTVGLNLPRQSPILLGERKPEMARDVEFKQTHQMIKDQNSNDGPTLWPELTLAASSGSQASYLQSSAAKAPVWLDSATCTSKQDLMQRGSSDVKMSRVYVHKKLWKRCAAHIHISKFIQRLQEPNSKDVLQQANHSNQLRANEGSMHGDLMEVQNSNRVGSAITSAHESGHSDTVKDSHDNKNSILQQSCHYHESLTPDVYGPQKPGFNVRLSAGGNRLKVNNKLDKVGGSRLESLPKMPMPYFQPLAQLPGLMGFPVPQNQYASTSYLNHQISATAPQFLHHYYGNPLWGCHNSSTTSNKQQQQNFWAMQVAAQGQSRSGVNCNMLRTQYPNWETGKQNNLVSPAMFPHSPVSLQVVGPKFPSIAEQQPQFIPLVSSLPQSRTNGLNFPVPPLSACEQSRGSFPISRGTPSLQLLCDERT